MDLDYRSNDHDAVMYVGECIKKALWPWTGEATLWMDDPNSLAGYERKICVEISLFPIERYPGHIFTYKLDVLGDIISDVKKMGEEAFNFYRYRPTLPIDDHIILGEE